MDKNMSNKIEFQIISQGNRARQTTPAVFYTINPYGMNKLSANGRVEYDLPVKYAYTVFGTTSDVNFTYSRLTPDFDFETEPTIPIVGLYANRDTLVQITLLDSAGTMFQGQVTLTEWNNMDFGDTRLTIDITAHDEEIAEASIAQGWIMDSYHNCYDKNGDLRLAGLNVGNMSALSIHDGYIYVMSESVNLQYNKEFYQYNLMGQLFKTFSAPEGFLFHHDCTFDGKGYMYVPGSIIAEPTDSEKIQSHIFKIDMETTEIVWQRDYSSEFMQQSILENGDTNDVHFNTCQYVDKLSQIIVNSRACSAIIGLDPDSGDFLWLIDNPAQKVIDDNLNLTVFNPDQFVYPNGTHTTFPTQNSKYASYRDGENRLAISMFDNKSCKAEDGTDIERLMESPQGSFVSYPFDSTAIIMGIDLTERTVEFLDEFVFPGQRSEFTSSVYDIGDYFCYYATTPSNLFVVDTTNKIGVEANIAASYRAKILTYDEIRSLVW